METRPIRVSENKSKDFAWYSSYETMGAVDGPGLRLVIFLQGCPLHCLFCHNPETVPWKEEKKITVDEVVRLYEKNREFYDLEGGVTLSGGEPMAQIDFVIEVFKRFKEMGVHTALDTAATPTAVYDMKQVKELIEVTDLFLIDIKHPDREKCIEITGQGNEYQIGLIKLLEKNKTKYWVRHVYLPTYSDIKEQYMIDLGKMIGNLKHMTKFELLPYHNMAVPKYEILGWKYKLEGVEPPTRDMTNRAMELIREGMQEVVKDPQKGLIIKG